MTPQTADQFGYLFILVPLGIIAATAVVLRLFPAVWSRTVERMDQPRIHTMDGARGLLALWVFTQHYNIGPYVLANGAWAAPPGRLGVLIASPLFIAPFFMLTAMLLGGRLLANGGRLGTMSFLVKRTFRLAPGYAVALGLIVFAAFSLSRFTLMVPPVALAKQLVRWSLLDFVTRYDINGVDVSRAYGIIWTLRYEVMFYLGLPVLAFLQRRIGSPLVIVFGLAAAGFFMWPFVFFTAGTLAAAATRLRGRVAVVMWQLGTVASVVLIAYTDIAQSLVMQAVLLVPPLVALALEAPLFRPLAWRPIRFIGEISYSVYILHSAIFYLLCVHVVEPRWLLGLPYVERVGMGVAIGCFVLVVATSCFVCVERPCIRFGNRLALRWSPGAGGAPGAPA